MATFLPCMLTRESGSPIQPPYWKPPLLEGSLDRSGWDPPSRSGYQADIVGILNQGHVTESGSICAAQDQWDYCAGLTAAYPEGLKGAGEKDRYKLRQHAGGTNLTTHLSAPAKKVYKGPQGLSVLRTCHHGQESQPNQPQAHQPASSLC